MAHPRGFEPLASAFGGQRSIQLSYGCLPRRIATRYCACNIGKNPNEEPASEWNAGSLAEVGSTSGTRRRTGDQASGERSAYGRS